jgi:hypothetical protein
VGTLRYLRVFMDSSAGFAPGPKSSNFIEKRPPGSVTYFTSLKLCYI